MKKPFALYVACLSLALVACGKKDEAPVVVNGGTVAVPGPGYPIPPSQPGISLSDYCSMNNGQYNGSTCSISSYTSYNYAGWGDVTSNVYVYAGQRVAVSMSGTATILVGGASQASGSSSFLSQYNGYLGFRKYSSFYSVSSIQVTSCFSAPAQLTPCS